MRNNQKRSAGVIPFRWRDGRLQVLLVHPGGPLWARRDDGAWSIAKGEYAVHEDPLEAARREFFEETGCLLENAPMVPLSEVQQMAGKLVRAWAVAVDLDPSNLRSNVFVMEWPRGSGRMREFPEVDRAEWFALAEARRKILASQQPFLDELERLLRTNASNG